jgi:hypothetical protein
MQWSLAELRGLPDSPEICEARFMLGHIHGNRDRYALAVEQFRLAHEMAVRIRVPRIASRAAVGAGLAEFRSGRPAEAERSLEIARALAADLGQDIEDVRFYVEKTEFKHGEQAHRASADNECVRLDDLGHIVCIPE